LAWNRSGVQNGSRVCRLAWPGIGVIVHVGWLGLESDGVQVGWLGLESEWCSGRLAGPGIGVVVHESISFIRMRTTIFRYVQIMEVQGSEADGGNDDKVPAISSKN